MPKLKVFELHWAGIETQLPLFIKDHQSLEKVKLVNCFAHVDASWKDLFIEVKHHPNILDFDAKAAIPMEVVVDKKLVARKDVPPDYVCKTFYHT